MTTHQLAEIRLSVVSLIQRQGSTEFDADLASRIESWILREPAGALADDCGKSPASSEGTQSRGNGPGRRRISRDTSSNHSHISKE